MPISPKQASDVCIVRSRRYLTIATRRFADDQAASDLYRSAVVSTVAAIDTYMHWLVINRLSAVRFTSELPKSLARTTIPFSDLAELADSTIDAQREERNIRPWVQVKNSIQSQILQKTFQSFEQVSDAFSMAGIEKPWRKISTEAGQPTSAIKTKLNRVVHRRNQIVHEGDIRRGSRPRNIQLNEISLRYAQSQVDWMDHLIAAMQRVVDAE